jgi:hypothetical protein
MMYTESMKIEFVPSSKETELTVPPPKPAKTYVPEWYKQIRPTDGLSLGHNKNENYDAGAIKRCMPFLDALTHGYIQETWTEIHIKKMESGHVSYNFPTGPTILDMGAPSMDVPDIFYPVQCAWRIHWMPKLPKGWSAMVTSPSNRMDLPFTSFTGIIDSDLFYGSNQGQGGNYPFYLKKDFEGIIPVGTPMYQIIPFKRENWKSVISEYNAEETLKRYTNVRKYLTNGYKKEYWQKKTFE